VIIDQIHRYRRQPICHGIKSIAAIDRIVAPIDTETVVSGTSLERIMSIYSNEMIIAVATDERVVEPMAYDDIVPGVATKPTRAIVGSSNCVVASQALDHDRARRGIDDVIVFGAENETDIGKIFSCCLTNR
jgi:hypothetical protein